MPHPIALELLDQEHARLMRDHYDDDPGAACDGCARAAAVRLELLDLSHPDNEGGMTP